jgi:hypothetical protein
MTPSAPTHRSLSGMRPLPCPVAASRSSSSVWCSRSSAREHHRPCASGSTSIAPRRARRSSKRRRRGARARRGRGAAHAGERALRHGRRRARARVAGVVLSRAALGHAHGVSLSSTRDSLAYDVRGLGYGAANLTLIARRGRAADRSSCRGSAACAGDSVRRDGAEVVTRHRDARDGLADHTLDRAHHRDLVRRHERVGVPFARRAPRTADAVT